MLSSRNVSEVRMVSLKVCTKYLSCTLLLGGRIKYAHTVHVCPYKHDFHNRYIAGGEYHD